MDWIVKMGQRDIFLPHDARREDDRSFVPMQELHDALIALSLPSPLDDLGLLLCRGISLVGVYQRCSPVPREYMPKGTIASLTVRRGR